MAFLHLLSTVARDPWEAQQHVFATKLAFLAADIAYRKTAHGARNAVERQEAFAPLLAAAKAMTEAEEAYKFTLLLTTAKQK